MEEPKKGGGWIWLLGIAGVGVVAWGLWKYFKKDGGGGGNGNGGEASYTCTLVTKSVCVGQDARVRVDWINPTAQPVALKLRLDLRQDDSNLTTMHEGAWIDLVLGPSTSGSGVLTCWVPTNWLGKSPRWRVMQSGISGSAWPLADEGIAVWGQYMSIEHITLVQC